MTNLKQNGSKSSEQIGNADVIGPRKIAKSYEQDSTAKKILKQSVLEYDLNSRFQLTSPNS